MVDEVLEHLDPQPGKVMVDLTVGAGGHLARLLEGAGPEGRVVGVDRDPAILEVARKVLEPFGERAELVLGSFGNFRAILDTLGIEVVDAVLLDLGVSSLQLDDPKRGFSFRESGPLDMRMRQGKGRTALDLIKSSSAEELERIFREYGEEPFARRIAGRLAELSRRRPPRTTAELAAFVESLVPEKLKGRRRVHPATRVFQALRIAVNDELGELEATLPDIASSLAPGGRVAVLSYHSLEDRMVKRFIRDRQKSGLLRALTKKPLTPGPEELRRNPRSRSVKLRVAERAAS
jgi:16S rRNA (cytosine1402-N4)-methyltransferase